MAVVTVELDVREGREYDAGVVGFTALHKLLAPFFKSASKHHTVETVHGFHCLHLNLKECRFHTHCFLLHTAFFLLPH